MVATILATNHESSDDGLTEGVSSSTTAVTSIRSPLGASGRSTYHPLTMELLQMLGCFLDGDSYEEKGPYLTDVGQRDICTACARSFEVGK